MTETISLKHSSLSNPPLVIKDEPTITSDLLYEGKTVCLRIPNQAFAKGAVSVEQKGNPTLFTNWKEEEHKEAFKLIRMTTQIWRENDIPHYLMYGKKSEINPKFEWQVIPVSLKGWKLWNLFKVFWNISFETGVKEKQSISLEKMSSIPEKVESDKNGLTCDPKVIESQRVFEGKTINILYHHAPLASGKDKIHFLFVPKRYCQEFSDLTEEEYLEITRASQLLVKHYAREGYPTAHLFNKNGFDKISNVPYWHQHLVFMTNRMEGTFSQLSLLTKLNVGTLPLSAQQLEKRVSALKWVLSNILD